MDVLHQLGLLQRMNEPPVQVEVEDNLPVLILCCNRLVNNK